MDIRYISQIVHVEKQIGGVVDFKVRWTALGFSTEPFGVIFSAKEALIIKQLSDLTWSHLQYN